MLLGSICWLTGNILLLTKFFYPLAFPWWAAFALFIIAAERLELMKFLPVSQLSKNIFVMLLLCFIIGVLLSFHGMGNLICGLALIGTSFWLLQYDAIVHSFFLGFVFSMIFAHGPMILPGIMGISIIPFNRILYLWLALLQASWLVRVFSDVLIEMALRKMSGLLSTIAILGYFVTMAIITIKGHRRAHIL